MNYTKLEFGKFLNDYMSNMPKGRGNCFDYGIISGCDYRCPALWDGECPEPAEVVGKLSDDIDNDNLIELKAIYKQQEVQHEKI